jgi:hypothetical protein
MRWIVNDDGEVVQIEALHISAHILSNQGQRERAVARFCFEEQLIRRHRGGVLDVGIQELRAITSCDYNVDAVGDVASHPNLQDDGVSVHGAGVCEIQAHMVTADLPYHLLLG